MEHLFLMFLDHTQRRSTVGRTPLDDWSARRKRPLPDNTRHSQQTNTHAPGEIRTQDLSRWAAFSRSPAEIVGSTPTGGMDICLLWVSCVVRERSLRRADHSSRGVLPTVLRRCVWSRNIKNRYCIYIYIYIYDISSLRVNDLYLILLTWRKWWANNASN
jgi:hypothetical protein